jgi:serine/threonine-protein phosphatase 2A regulatory subunit A
MFRLAKVTEMDQVLLALAKKLGDLGPYIGGPEHTHVLIPLLEALCCVEESVVRSSASASCSKLLTSVSSSHSLTTGGMFNLLKRLCSEDQGEIFYSKVSACQIIDEVFRICPSERPAIQDIYLALGRDEMTIVRRAAALAFPKILRHADPSAQSSQYLDLIKNMNTPEEHPTVKEIAIQNYVAFFTTLRASNALASIMNEIVPLVKLAADDSSWKVRLAIAKDFGSLAECFPQDIVSSEIFPSFIHLIQDSEADVRALACASAVPFIDVVGPDLFLSEVVPIAVQLSEDSAPGTLSTHTPLFSSGVISKLYLFICVYLCVVCFF